MAFGLYNVVPPSSYGNKGVSYMACHKPSLLHISMDKGLSNCWACSKTCCGKWHRCFGYIANGLDHKLKLKYAGFQDIDMLIEYLKKLILERERERDPKMPMWSCTLACHIFHTWHIHIHTEYNIDSIIIVSMHILHIMWSSMYVLYVHVYATYVNVGVYLKTFQRNFNCP